MVQGVSSIKDISTLGEGGGSNDADKSGKGKGGSLSSSSSFLNSAASTTRSPFSFSAWNV